MQNLWQDLRYGARMLLKKPGFTLIAVLTLALGIGANTAIFSLLDALLLKRLPVKHPEQLVVVAAAAPEEEPPSSLSYPVFRELEEKNSVLAGMFVYLPWQMSMSEVGKADNQTPGAHPVTVISYNYWQRRFGADPQIVGKTISLNGYPFTISGVAAQGFHGVQVGKAPDVRIPIMMSSQVQVRVRNDDLPITEDRENTLIRVMARLKPGVSIEQAQAAADTLFQIIREPDVRGIKGDSPNDRMVKSRRIRLSSAKTGVSNLRADFSQPLIVLMCLVGVVLLIACLNVANLLLARAATRQKEIAVRLALGASRFRLVRQLLTEGLLLSALGGVLGLLFARLGTEGLLGFLPPGTVIEIEPDLRMLGFTLGVTVLTGLLFGLAPALQATRPDLIPALKNDAVIVVGSGRKLELRRLLVVLQVALSLVLLTTAGLFVRSLRNLKAVDHGYNTDQVVTLTIDPSQIGYKLDQGRHFYAQLSERVAALPGVKSATYAWSLPLSRRSSGWLGGLDVPGYRPRPSEEQTFLLNNVGAQFFATFGIPLLRGRDFNAQDTPESPKAIIVNHRLARIFFGSESPVGTRISIGPFKDLEIVGVVGDAKYHNLKEAMPPTIYIPYSQYGLTEARTLCVRAVQCHRPGCRHSARGPQPRSKPAHL